MRIAVAGTIVETDNRIAATLTPPEMYDGPVSEISFNVYPDADVAEVKFFETPKIQGIRRYEHPDVEGARKIARQYLADGWTWKEGE